MSGAVPQDTPGASGETLDFAEKYAALGWPVFPVHSIRDGCCTCGRSTCGRPGKHPRTPNGVKDATVDLQRIRRWGDRWRASNIAVATGPVSGLVVIDIEDERALEALVDRYGPLPDSVQQFTGRGEQRFFRYPDGAVVRNKTDVSGCRGVDVRGVGGYAIVPPSQHLSGKKYIWEVASDPTDGAQLAALPPAWVDLLTEPVATKALLTGQVDAGILREGQRNEALFRLASSMRAKGMSKEAIEAALIEENKARCRPPLNEREVRRIAGSAARYTPGAVSGGTESNPWKPFPVEVPPPVLRQFVTEAGQSIGCDVSMVALPVLAVCAGAIGNSRVIRLKRGWVEPAVVWTALVAESGTLKSPAQDCAILPVYEAQDRKFREYAEELEQYEQEKLRYETELKDWQKLKQGKRGDPPKKPQAPTCERLLVADTTVEALATILAENPRGVLLARDEVGAWLAGFDRYRAQRGGDVQCWLEAHRAGRWIIDRKTGNPKTLVIPRAAVSVTGTIQPLTLKRLLNSEYFECGLAARLLLAAPPRRRKRWSDATVSEPTVTAFADVIATLAKLQMDTDPNGNDMPMVVELSKAGRDAWIAWYERFAGRQDDAEGHLASAFSKLEGAAARFALIFSLVRWASVPDETQLAIEPGDIEAGATVAEWFADEAERIYAQWRETGEDREQRELVEWIRKRSGSTTVRDITHGIWKYRGCGDAVMEMLNGLVKAGKGRWDSSAAPKGGRPAQKFVLNDITSITITETPTDDTRSEGFGDGDVGDARGEDHCGDGGSG